MKLAECGPMEEFRRRRVSTTLVRQPTDWGVSVSEKRVRRFWLNTVLYAVSIIALFASLFIVLPPLAALISQANVAGVSFPILIVASFVVLAAFVRHQSRKGKRNAFELDSAYRELRIGHMNRREKFVCQRAIPLAQVDDAVADYGPLGEPELVVTSRGEQFRIALADAKRQRMTDLVDQINKAASYARTAPRPRSRIMSAIVEIGAKRNA